MTGSVGDFSYLRVVGCVLVVIAVPAAVLFYATAGGPHHDRRYLRQRACASNLKQLAMAANAYAADHDGHLPPGPEWDAPLRDRNTNQHTFICPADPHGGPLSYGMNLRLFGARVSDHDPDTVLFHDGWNGTVVNRHRGAANYVFLSGEATASLDEPPEGLPVVALDSDPR